MRDSPDDGELLLKLGVFAVEVGIRPRGGHAHDERGPAVAPRSSTSGGGRQARPGEVHARGGSGRAAGGRARARGKRDRGGSDGESGHRIDRCLTTCAVWCVGGPRWGGSLFCKVSPKDETWPNGRTSLMTGGRGARRVSIRVSRWELLFLFLFPRGVLP